MTDHTRDSASFAERANPCPAVSSRDPETGSALVQKANEMRARAEDALSVTDAGSGYVHPLAVLRFDSRVPQLARDVIAALDSEAEVRRQHDVVMDAIKRGDGLKIGDTEWRDKDYRQWDIRLQRVVECPSCCFTFGAEHESMDDNGEYLGYDCPLCELTANAVSARGGTPLPADSPAVLPAPQNEDLGAESAKNADARAQTETFEALRARRFVAFAEDARTTKLTSLGRAQARVEVLAEYVLELARREAALKEELEGSAGELVRLQATNREYETLVAELRSALEAHAWHIGDELCWCPEGWFDREPETGAYNHDDSDHSPACVASRAALSAALPVVPPALPDTTETDSVAGEKRSAPDGEAGA